MTTYYQVGMVDLDTVSPGEEIPAGTMVMNNGALSFTTSSGPVEQIADNTSPSVRSFVKTQWVDGSSSGKCWTQIDSSLSIEPNSVAMIEANIIGVDEESKVNAYNLYFTIRNEVGEDQEAVSFSATQIEEEKSGNATPSYKGGLIGVNVRGGSDKNWTWRIELRLICLPKP